VTGERLPASEIRSETEDETEPIGCPRHILEQYVKTHFYCDVSVEILHQALFLLAKLSYADQESVRDSDIGNVIKDAIDKRYFEDVPRSAVKRKRSDVGPH
jgi:hypothetical protein